MYKSMLVICYQNFSQFSICLLSICLSVSRNLLSRTRMAPGPESIAIYVRISSDNLSLQARCPSRGIKQLIGFSRRTNTQTGLLCEFPFKNRKDSGPIEPREQSRSWHVVHFFACELLCITHSQLCHKYSTQARIRSPTRSTPCYYCVTYN